MALLAILLLLVSPAMANERRLAEKARAQTERKARTLAERARDQTYTIPLPPKWAITRGSAVLEDGQLGTGGWSIGQTGEIRLPEAEPGERVGRADVFSAAHELAHALDAQSLDDPWRRRFQSIMGAPAGPWDTGTGPNGKRSPSEWFGDYYGAAAINMRPMEGMGAYVDDITPRRLRQFRRALSEFAATKPELEPLRRRAIRRALSAPSAG